MQRVLELWNRGERGRRIGIAPTKQCFRGSKFAATTMTVTLGLACIGAASAQSAPPLPAPPIASTAPSTTSSAVKGGAIQGVVKSGNAPIPGATVTAANTLTGQKVTTWTDFVGHFVLQVPADGRYVIRGQMLAFAPATQEARIGTTSRSANVTLEMVLQSRVQSDSPATQLAALAAGKGFQNLTLGQGDGTGFAGASSASGSEQTVAGLSNNISTESVSVQGNASASEFGGFPGDPRGRWDSQQGGGSGGPGGGPGGGGGFGGGPGGFSPFGRGRPNFNRPHGTAYYSVGDSALNAAPYSLTGAPTAKPSYIQHQFGFALGGLLNIPKIYQGGSKTFFFLNFNGARANNPFDAFSTVPTLLERAGNFSQTTIQTRDATGARTNIPVQLFDPTTGLPIPGNVLTNINPAAAGLLAYIPKPNLPGTQQNFHYVTSVKSNNNDLNFRLNRSLAKGASKGALPPNPFRGPQNSINIGLHYHSSDGTLTNPFPSVSGTTSVRSWDVPLGYVRSFGKFTNRFTLDFNRNQISTRNLYQGATDITGGLGITGVSTNPFDYGLPGLSFTDYGSLSDTNPLLRRDQTWSLSESLIWNHAKHTWRWGGDYRRIQLNTETSTNARGSFVFTGLNTSGVGTPGPSAGDGYDLADFLLGLPQQTSVQFGANNYHFRGTSWDLFAQDDWKVRSNLTLNLGLRYEYVSPLTELNNRIVNLDVNSGITAAVPVLAGAIGAFSGRFPAALVRPDRNNFAPRIGIAWKARAKTVVRAGCGINYNNGAYQSIVQQLAFQPPFSTTQTNVQAAVGALTLQNGFPAVTEGQVTNNYGVDPNYRLGYVQVWNVDVQQEIRPTLLLNLSYNGTKGTRLDIVTAPNRDATGVRIPNVQAFTFEDSLGDSTANSLSVRLRKRLRAGISFSGNYTWSKALDNASSIGGGSTVVAQNAFDLRAERGLSSFDQRHRFTGDWVWELPVGHEKRWLAQKSAARAVLGDWQWTGDWTIASGTPFSPRILGSTTDVSRGTNGTLRPDVTGAEIALDNPTIERYFNTAAFTLPPAGRFGDARRNSIIGPGSLLFNMAMTKSFPLRDAMSLELRAQASNVFNTPQFTGIDPIINSPTFGQVIAVGSTRTMRVSARFRF